MWKFLSLSLVILSGLAAEVPAPAPQNAQQPPPQPPKAPVEPQPTPSSPAPGVKNQTASGRYHGGYDGGYDGQHGYGHRIFRGYDVPLVDDYVCDLDATLLLVTNSDGYDQDNSYSGPAQGATYGRAKRDAYGPSEYGRDSYGSRDHYGSRDNYDGRDGYGPSRDHYGHHGYGAKYDHGHDYDHHHGYGVSANADRLRCSIIANWDKDACTRCCRLSARRDRSISKHKIIGFLVDNNQLNYDPPTGGDSHGDNYSARKKRSDSYGPAQTYSQPAYSPPVEAPEPEGDYRCVCCAPKRYRPFIFDRFFRRHGHHHRYGGYDAPY